MLSRNEKLMLAGSLLLAVVVGVVLNRAIVPSIPETEIQARLLVSVAIGIVAGLAAASICGLYFLFKD